MNHDERIGFEPGTSLSYRLAAARLRCRAETAPEEANKLRACSSDLDVVADILDGMPSDVINMLESADGGYSYAGLRPSASH